MRTNGNWCVRVDGSLSGAGYQNCRAGDEERTIFNVISNSGLVIYTTTPSRNFSWPWDNWDYYGCEADRFLEEKPCWYKVSRRKLQFFGQYILIWEVLEAQWETISYIHHVLAQISHILYKFPPQRSEDNEPQKFLAYLFFFLDTALGVVDDWGSAQPTIRGRMGTFLFLGAGRTIE